jgi:hypothetical protein
MKMRRMGSDIHLKRDRAVETHMQTPECWKAEWGACHR